MDRNELARVALGVFMDCSGFDGWWEGIDEETQADILDELDKELAAAALRQSAWRPMSEAPARCSVMVWCERGAVVACSDDEGWWSGFDEYGNDQELTDVTAWQPLPPPPADEVVG